MNPQISKVSTFLLCCFFTLLKVNAQPIAIDKLIINSDSTETTFPGDLISYKNSQYLPVYYLKPDQVCELNIYPKTGYLINKINSSPDFDLLDSLTFLNNTYYRIRLKFRNLNNSAFVNITLQNVRTSDSTKITEEIKLFPFTFTSVNFFPPTDELFIGEEKVFELVSNNPGNIKISTEWVTTDGFNYRISERNGILRLHVLPTSFGTKTLQVNLQSQSAFLDKNKNPTFNLPTISYTFRIKNSRLNFLRFDQPEITLDENSRTTGIEVTLDNNKNLLLHKTYRIESQEENGGPLIAELFTKSYLANDKMLCIFRPYNFHRQTESYLYIKDGDDAKFITNINITPKTSITGIYIMRNGQDWQPGNVVYPGETVDVKLEGEALHKARFYWEGISGVTTDTLTQNEKSCTFRLTIPLSINKKKISLYNYNQVTSTSLNVREYQIAKPLDFISINSGTGKKTLVNNNTTIIQRKTIPDITLQFDNTKIDNSTKLYGKQYVDVDIKLLGKRGELIEFKNLKNVVVCPGDNSPRAAFYTDNNCNSDQISLNSLLSNKTYNMEDFSKIQMEFKNSDDKYSERTPVKTVEIIIQHQVAFDIDVSFPAGLLIQNLGKTAAEKENQEKAVFTDNLGGISLALVAQFSFPDANKVGKLKPYRLGAGFLAINAFNFSASAKRDLAAVVLASLYPIKPGKVFNMPIHFGFGYKFQDKIPFLMLSPGIGIRF